VEQLIPVLLNAGVAGAVLAWFLFRQEKINAENVKVQQKVAEALNRMVRAQMILAITTNEPSSPSGKRLANELLKEVTPAMTGDGGVSPSP
jgi:hypothetical protein